MSAQRDDHEPALTRAGRSRPPPLGAVVIPVEMHEISLTAFAGKYIRLLWLHILLAGACFAVAHYVIGTLPVRYQANALAIYQNNTKSGATPAVGTGSPLDLLLGPQAASSELMQVLALIRMRNFLLPLVERRDLLPIIFGDRWDENAGRWLPPGSAPPSVMAGYGELAEGIDSKVNGTTKIITFGVTARTAEAAYRLTDIILEEFSKMYRADMVAESERAISFIQRELDRTTNIDLRDLLLALYQQELRQQILLSVQPDVPFKIVESATLPGGPSTPNKPLIYKVTGAVAVALSFFVTMVFPSGWLRRRRK